MPSAASISLGDFTLPGEVECPTICVGDRNGDGSVDGLDLLLMLSNWGSHP